MPLSQLQVANRALTEIARSTVLASGDVATNFDGTTAGIACATLYPGGVVMLLRQQDYEFSRKDAALAMSGNEPPGEWMYEYVYPADCLRVRQVRPATWDETDPQPVPWEVGTAVVSASQTTVIWTNQQSAWLVYTTDDVTENDWDPSFAEQFVRYLGSAVALPVGGRPDFSREQLKIAGALGQANQDRDS